MEWDGVIGGGVGSSVGRSRVPGWGQHRRRGQAGRGCLRQEQSQSQEAVVEGVATGWGPGGQAHRGAGAVAAAVG